MFISKKEKRKLINQPSGFLLSKPKQNMKKIINLYSLVILTLSNRVNTQNIQSIIKCVLKRRRVDTAGGSIQTKEIVHNTVNEIIFNFYFNRITLQTNFNNIYSHL
jgi:predicted GTPase